MNAGGYAFSVDLLERNGAKGHGLITCMAAGNDVILIGTSKGWLIRHDFGIGDSYDIDLSGGRGGDQPVHRVFVDPGGSHCIANVLHAGGAETYYTHAKWAKPRVLSRLKGLIVNAVAWNRQQITEASTREVLIGTENGQMYEVEVDEVDKKEKHVKFLFELTELPESIMGLQMETASLGNVTRYYVMSVTPTRLYSFTGIGALDTMFASYSERAVHFMELPGEIPNSELHFFIMQRRAKYFAWLSGAGIYHGDLNFGAQHSSSDGDENFVENKGLLDYAKLGEAMKPRSLAVSEFHFLLLIGENVKVVNRISQQIVEELKFDHAPDSISKGIIGLCSDASAGLFYAYDDSSVFQVSTLDEGRDMWKIHLDMKEYVAALAHCRSPLQRDQIYLIQAEAAFSAKEYYRAASFYAKVNYILSFEEISLKFIAIAEQDALRTFLLRKLDNLTNDDKCQVTMISTWITELYLDKINRLLLEDDPITIGNTPAASSNTEYQSIIKEFKSFLSDSKDVLDEATTMKLLESYGRVEELVFFAALKEQYEIVIHHYIQQGETKKALEVLQRPNISVDLQYKFSPDLIMLDAYETVETWMTTDKLNPRKLIPAMMRYASEPHAKNETHEVIKYLEYSIHHLHNEDPGVHNLLLSLYAKQEDDSALLRFLQCKFGKGRVDGLEFFYDPKYALRLCLKEKRMRACVHIYSMMCMHEEAVALALQAPHTNEAGEPSRQNTTPEIVMDDGGAAAAPAAPAVPEPTDLAAIIARAVAIALLEFRNGLPASGPAAVPVPAAGDLGMDRYLRNFRDLQPSNFNGEETPMETDDWLIRTRDLLEVMQCPENKKVPLAAFLLKGEANLWWTRHLADDPAGRTADMFTWNNFSTALSTWFVPPSERRSLQEKYLRLFQGDKTVIAYERELTHLSRYAGIMQGDENEKCSRFVDGLRDSLRQPLMTMVNADYRSLVDTARKLEADQQKVQKRINFRSKRTQDAPQQQQHQNKNNQGKNWNKKQRSDDKKGGQTESKVKDYPLCSKCYRHHLGECLAAAGVCYKCHQPGHIARYCQGTPVVQIDPELAMAEADKVEDDEDQDLRKKLWLMVAKHVIQLEKGVKRENIRKAIAFLKETDGLLKIEDILPFFPDFALIDDFKEAICSSLEDYNMQIKILKEEMDDATHGADNIRSDITALAQRYAVVERDEECGVCKRKILPTGGAHQVGRGYMPIGPMAPFYVFPCGHSFHAQCLIAHVTQCTTQSQAELILEIQKQLSLLGGKVTKDAGSRTNDDSVTTTVSANKLRSKLDDAVASECPFCGELMIREISKPFISPEESEQVASWQIKPQVSTQKILPMSLSI